MGEAANWKAEIGCGKKMDPLRTQRLGWNDAGTAVGHVNRRAGCKRGHSKLLEKGLEM